MLATARFKQLEEFIKASSKEELIWVNGYLSGLINSIPETIGEEPTPAAKRITIAYGTETGNAQKLATTFAARAKKSGIPAKLVSLDQYRLGDLDREEYFFTVISTQGDGEPPVAAKKFYEHIHNNGFKIPALRYSVLALGDTAYPLFCKTGEEVDEQLEKLGGNRFVPMQKCDLDFEADAERWMNEILGRLQTTTVAPMQKAIVQPAPVQKATEKKWYTATILENINLTATGSSRRTYHIALSVPGIEYLPGDSIAIIPKNDNAEVNAILEAAQLPADTEVVWKKESWSLQTLLSQKANIRFLTEKAVQQYAAIAGHTIPSQRKDLLQLLEDFPIKDKTRFEAVIQLLNPIAPRIYNIASSPAAHPGEIHIIVAQDQFAEEDTIRTGLCTAHLESLQPGDALSFFIQTNKRFRLPEAEKNIIMIGPGTGIAPFRSFVAERDANGDTGGNWLFFGERDFTTDFYYQAEWQAWFNTGTLTRASLAFETNNNGLTSVEHKLLQQAAALFEWISNGAYIYLCGEKDPMSRTVEETLLNIFREHGKQTAEEAKAFFEQLKKDGRYVKDVY